MEIIDVTDFSEMLLIFKIILVKKYIKKNIFFIFKN